MVSMNKKSSVFVIYFLTTFTICLSLFIGFSGFGYLIFRYNHNNTKVNGSYGEHSFSERSYMPPMACSILISSYGQNAILEVRGLNSTIFCRRVLSIFENDRNFITEEIPVENDVFSDDVLVCSIAGQDFVVNVLSNSKLGNFICREIEPQSIT